MPLTSSRPVRARRVRAATAALLTGVLTAGALSTITPAAVAAPESPLHQVIPAPESVREDPGVEFTLTAESAISADPGASEVADYLAGVLRPATGFPLPVAEGGAGDVALRLDDADLGPAGYRLDVAGDAVTLHAGGADGLFNGVQTLRQLLPATIESPQVRPGPWTIPGGEITDRPRYEHRAAGLDVARHFFDVESVKRYIDQIALYKMNFLRLHLSDDQGWRIQINDWPRLTEHGGSTEVGGGPGGFYTQQDYSEIVAYAESRHVTIIPEIDTPGHTNAALSSYAELNCDGVAPPLYTGIEVGFSSLCVDKDVTYEFLDDVIREIAALTPGPYLHIGGDEADATSDEQYRAFMDRALPIVEKYGKTAVGWHEYAKAEPQAGSVVQYWGVEAAEADTMAAAAARGNKILMSPADKSYLDMKYDESTELGLSWAAYIEVADAYGWDPASHLPGVPAESVLGIEAPMWTETLENSAHLETMAFPRLPAIAELGWSPAATHDWESFRTRLAEQGPRWTAAGIGFTRSPQIPWP
ncbi:beta-N-acetylhexosaminidase [Saccharopolyspora gloriosae]|uniref:beta-N-acetylhexosaminidase n=1 Tax=Saccharopolyspora gloriosae TaxID=455344 RepID=UPI0028681832|nr:beta-N-acetylhexosaminidase [Saccharopolyspora gloriosae]